MPICNSCGQEKSEEEFNWRYRVLGIRHPTCKECQKGFRKNWYEGDAHERHLENVQARKKVVREIAREYVYQYLLTHPCQGTLPNGEPCLESDPRVLEFHHTGRKGKAVSELVAGGYSIETIQAEINKCIVLCSNCHRKLTMKDRGWFRGKK
jgi:hypothetical protein